MRYFYSFLQKVLQIKNKMLSSKGTILMFHEIVQDDVSRTNMDFAIKSSSLELLLKQLENSGYRFKPINNISNSNKGDIYITFDDVYESVFILAYPILKRFNIPFLIFISYEYIDKPKYLSSKMLDVLAKEQLCTIGSHTISHPILRFCSKEKAKIEIIGSKALIENKLNKKVDYFAFPYGSLYACSKKYIELVKEAGYLFSFSTLNSSFTQKDVSKGVFIPRKNVCEDNYRKIMNEIENE